MSTIGELRSQFYVALDASYLGEVQFQELRGQVETCSCQIARFMQVLGSRSNSLRTRDGQVEYHVD